MQLHILAATDVAAQLRRIRLGKRRLIGEMLFSKSDNGPAAATGAFGA